jgi:cytochrome c biogenesis factor
MKYLFIFTWWLIGSIAGIVLLYAVPGGSHGSFLTFFLFFTLFLLVQSFLLRKTLDYFFPKGRRDNVLWAIAMSALISISFLAFLIVVATLSGVLKG